MPCAHAVSTWFAGEMQIYSSSANHILAEGAPPLGQRFPIDTRTMGFKEIVYLAREVRVTPLRHRCLAIVQRYYRMPTGALLAFLLYRIDARLVCPLVDLR